MDEIPNFPVTIDRASFTSCGVNYDTRCKTSCRIKKPGTLQVVVPTIFDQTTAADLEDAGAKIIIYANQPVRAAIRAMTDMLQELMNQGHRIQAVPLFKKWMEVDSFEEYQTAWTKLRQ
ncbi:MAG: hypothetical protein AAB308_16530 [Nitrospirota bacterium]